MNGRWLGVLGIFFIWSIGSWWYYVHQIKGYGLSKQPKKEIIQDDIHGIAFNSNTPEPLTGSHFNAFKDSVLALKNGQTKLVITGYYYPSEAAVTSGIDLGLERARNIKTLFPELGDEEVVLRSEVISGVIPSKDPFEACGLAWEYMEDEASSPVEAAPATETIATLPVQKEIPHITVEEILDGLVIYFPSNSNQKISDATVDKALAKLAKNAINDGQPVTVTGHSDANGDNQKNYSLALQRANAIRDILIRKGVPSGQISAESKGESMPIADNKTEEGRQKNRRVEIKY
ncbi:MAG: OmpA family protein [Chitinophagales bacterium]|nr:OmpA family protein [Chitinophagales bacterium]